MDDMQWVYKTGTRWVSVDKALPPRRMWVIVYHNDAGPYNDEPNVFVALYKDGKFFWPFDKVPENKMNVSHWCEFPCPPQIADSLAK